MMSPRAVAFHVLILVEQRNIHPDALLRTTLQRHNNLSAEDRALVTELVYGVLRWRGRLDWYIEQLSKTPLRKISLQVMTLLRLGLYQIAFLEKIPDHAAVDEVVKIAKATQPRYIVSFVNGILRNAARTNPNWKLPDKEEDPIKYLAVLTSHPRWFIEKLANQMDVNEIHRLCEFNNTIAPLTFRINTLKTSPDTVINWFKKHGYEAQPGIYVSEALTVKKFRQDLSSIEIFNEGWIQVQDEASQLICYIVSPKPGEKILDLCSGYGVKTTHMAQFMENNGSILAVDNASWKLEALMHNASRLGVADTITTLTSDIRSLNVNDIGLFDRVLLDAPCTGWGTIRRNPDIKWKTHPRDPWRMSQLQWDLLNHAAQFVKSGGTITYVTCSIFHEENLDIANRFQEKWKWEIINPSEKLPDSARHLVRNGFYQSWPHKDGIDGFFAATWIKP